MEQNLKYSLIAFFAYFPIAFLIFIQMGGLKEGNVAGFGIAFILIGGGIFALLLLALNIALCAYNWIIKTFYPLQYTQKDFLIILTHKDTVVVYCQYVGTFFKQVFNIQNQTIHSQALSFLKNNHNQYIWEPSPQFPNKQIQTILYRAISLFIKEDLQPTPQILNAKNLFLSPLYLSLIKKIGKDEFDDLLQSSNPQFRITADAKWTPIQKKLLYKERLKSTLFALLVCIIVLAFFFLPTFAYPLLSYCLGV